MTHQENGLTDALLERLADVTETGAGVTLMEIEAMARELLARRRSETMARLALQGLDDSAPGRRS